MIEIENGSPTAAAEAGLIVVQGIPNCVVTLTPEAALVLADELSVAAAKALTQRQVGETATEVYPRG